VSLLEPAPGARLADLTATEATKWSFARRRGLAVFLAHGFREVAPSPLEPAGLTERLLGRTALRVEGDLELRSDPLVSLAKLFCDSGSGDRFARWMVADRAFDRGPESRQRTTAWQALSGMSFGVGDPAADAEIILLIENLIGDLGLIAPEVRVGTLGDPEDLARYLAATTEARELTCATCQAAPSPIRFLSCSDEGCVAVAASVPPIREFLSATAGAHHATVLGLLAASNCRATDDPRLAFSSRKFVRTVFEVTAVREDNAQRRIAVARGGRCDPLVRALAASATATGAAVGVTLGVKNAADCMPGGCDGYESACEIFFASFGAAARAFALKAAALERARGFRVDVELRDTDHAEQLERAARLRARVIVIVGDPDHRAGEVTLRDMQTQSTYHVPEESLSLELKRLLR
jgi:histidyl-tRNA synthetase